MQKYSQVNQVKKEKWITDRCHETYCGKRKNKTAFNTLTLLTQRQQTKTNLIEKAKRKLLTDDKSIHRRWIECYTELYNYKLTSDASILKSGYNVENREAGDSHILKEEVEKAVRVLKDDKSPGVDNIPAEILNTEDQA